GEMGLDFFRNLSPPDVQARAFRRQLELARRLRKPVVIHCRDAHEEALAILADERVGEVGGVMHCFSADVPVAKRCLDLGLFISAEGVAMGECRTLRTMCPMNCHPTLCGMLVEVEDGRLLAVKGDPDNPDSRGFLCIRGQASREIIGNPKRLLTPLIRARRTE